MAFQQEHELHKRRFGRNMALLAVLCGFAALIFGLTIVKVGQGEPLEGFDHVARPSLAETEAKQ